MKKISTILLALLCALQTAFAWEPSEPYCTFCNNFRFDCAFRFYNAGGAENGSKYSSGGFSGVSWRDSLLPVDMGLQKALSGDQLWYEMGGSLSDSRWSAGYDDC